MNIFLDSVILLVACIVIVLVKPVYAGSNYQAFAKKWAPLVRLAVGEQFRPSSVDFFLKYVKMTGSHTSTNTPSKLTPSSVPKCHKGCFLETIKKLRSSTDTNQIVFKGQSPSIAPAYAVITETQKTISINYWFFYPYNRGKDVCIGVYNSKSNFCPCPKLWGHCPCPRIPKGCLGDWKSFGHHVGDWENIEVTLHKNGNPIKINFKAHGDAHEFQFNGKHFVYQGEVLMFEGSHPIVYSAKGSHGARARAGRYVYKTLPNKSQLVDVTSNGEAWRTWQNLMVVNRRLGQPFPSGWANFFNYQGRWGNPKQGCGLFKIFEKISGECVLNSGPRSKYYY